ncbi:acetyl-CoA carboxylase biotin carboxyl carrier protein subunit [Nonomuraea aridisoli]|uniref:Biotin carboxyl carrier protein of acetyl-CoA carboxylase n=1 Tax=Nonomuraea aridisoli TaxID=2070368 RepID=A0A2W2EPS7_9ACTN|nr:acetyl-CoA carboxylase biotin carboxyl carrier protein subunit [Nonomuraea aridisoli]
MESVRDSAALLLSQVARPPSLLRLEAGEVVIELRWDPPAAGTERPQDAPRPEPDAAETPIGPALVRSPTVGVFYHAPEPGNPPFVTEGSLVEPGQQVGIVEAMKMMIPVRAEQHGRVLAVLKGDGEQVEYAEGLMSLEVMD